MSAMGWLGFSGTEEGDRLIDIERPYGTGQFGQIGGRARVIVDTRSSPWDEASLNIPFSINPAAGYPTGGFYFEALGEVAPPVWSPDEVWGSVAGSLSAYTGVFNSRLAGSMRVGGKHTFGRTPYFNAAYLGGGGVFSGFSANRGFAQQRFGGQSSVFGNVDVRLFIARFPIVVPGDFGINTFFDVGRVFVDGESSNDWHPSGGGGFWFAPLVRTNTLVFSVAASDEDVRFYFRAGLHY